MSKESVSCESCNKLIDKDKAFDLSDGEGIYMCEDCYKKYTEYQVEKIQRNSVYGVLGNGKKTSRK